MDIIHLLPDSVANQIAAGEVVQRPASVVKELMENAIDAGAKNISVLLEDAGRTSIQVIDDGKGMSETDARLAFERHATSKISKADDLLSLSTMGFRGEALPSIAAVAQVRLQTRTAEQELGTKLTIDGSTVKSQEPCACPVGANFEVRNLFFNVPARRKFLKSNQTELNNIVQEFQRIALVNPKVSFSLTHNETLMVQLPSSGLRQRVSNILGRRIGEGLIEVEVETSLLKLSGFVGRPETARKKESHQYLFVNGRFMRHPYFHRAVLTAYEHLIPEGDQIPYLLYFQVEPSSIDVNIHPTKTEIKFENEMALWQMVVAAIREALGRYNAVPNIEFDTEGKPDIPVFEGDQKKDIQAPQLQLTPGYNPFRTGKTRTSGVNWELLYDGIERDKKNIENPDNQDEALNQGLQTSSGTIANPSQTSDIAETDSLLPLEGMSIEPAGTVHMQYHGQYILTAMQSGLMMVDQHRAHIRILYERYLNRLSSREASTQGLLFPELIQLTVSETNVMESVMDIFQNLGFDISDLGGGSFSLLGVPNDLDGADPIKLVHELLSEFEEELKDGGAEAAKHKVKSLNHHAALTMARHTAIAIGQVLSDNEMEVLLSDLFNCRMPAITPTGEPVLTIFHEEEIGKHFNNKNSRNEQ